MRKNIFYFNATPIFKLLVPYILGLVLAYLTHISPVYIILILLLGLIIAIHQTFKNKLYSTSWYLGIALLFFSVGMGIFYFHYNTERNYLKIKDCKNFIGIVNSLPIPKNKYTSYEVKLHSYEKKGWKPIRTKIILNIYESISLPQGGYILLKNVNIKLQTHQNFPYAKPQSEKLFINKICGIVNLNKSSSLIILPFKSKSIIHKIQILRFFILSHIDKYFPIQRDLAIFQSLFLGYRSLLDNELANAYSVAGVRHILSVSGLHVGIIYLFLVFITQPLHRRKYGKYLSIILIIFCIWSYGLLSGFSSPVIRSCAMFSILGIVDLIKRQHFSFNSLFLSAFIILLFDPLQLFNVGFQLSYSAMTGIFLFFKPLSNVLPERNRILKKIWELITISISAQMGTLPLMLFYFNQFPSYFVLSNIVIVPLTSIILYCGIVFLILLPIPLFANGIAYIINFFISALNKMVLTIEKLPYATLDNFYPSKIQIIFLSLIILQIAYVMHKRSIQNLPIMLFAILGIQIDEANKIIRSWNERLIIVFPINDSFVVSYLHQTQLYHFVLTNDVNRIKSLTKDFRKQYYISKEIFVDQSNLLTEKVEPTEFSIEGIKFRLSKLTYQNFEVKNSGYDLCKNNKHRLTYFSDKKLSFSMQNGFFLLNLN